MKKNSRNAARWEAFFERTSPEELLEDLEEINKMLTDIMLPAIFNRPKRNTIARDLLKRALAEKKYKRKLTEVVMRNALKWPQPYQWLYGTFKDLVDAIQPGDKPDA